MLLLVVATPAVTSAENTLFREHQVKAAFIYNFALYVEWPASATGEQKPRTICLLGTDYFGTALNAVHGKAVRNQRLAVRLIKEVEEAETCDILYISTSEYGNLQEILETVRQRPVLTISDLDRFARSGGMIGLVTRDNKVRFEINLKQTQRAQFRVSSQLLKLARDVIE